MEVFPIDVGEYRLMGRLAAGGMAEIFRADPVAGGESVVLKRLRPQFREDPAYVDRFVGEAKLCVKLRHPNVVRTHKLFKKGPDYFMVQELVDGLSLRGLLDYRRRLRTPLPVAASLRVCTGLLSALDYVHRAKLGDEDVSVVHRDVNPANVLLDRGGGVKLTDFGVAEASLHPELHAEQGALAGTPAYMSPEQVVGGALDPRSDIFSAGSVLYECLANRPPFGGEAEYEILSSVKEAKPAPLKLEGKGAALREAVETAMARDPAGRFPTAAAFHKALLAAAQTLGELPAADALAESVVEALEGDEPTQV